jgi:hypothetical protein
MRAYDDEIDRPVARQVYNGLIGDALDNHAVAVEPGVLDPLLCHMHLVLRRSLQRL